MDDLAKGRPCVDIRLHLPDILSLRLGRYRFCGRVGGERAVRFGQHDAMPFDVAATIQKVRMRIERTG